MKPSETVVVAYAREARGPAKPVELCSPPVATLSVRDGASVLEFDAPGDRGRVTVNELFVETAATFKLTVRHVEGASLKFETARAHEAGYLRTEDLRLVVEAGESHHVLAFETCADERSATFDVTPTLNAEKPALKLKVTIRRNPTRE